MSNCFLHKKHSASRHWQKLHFNACILPVDCFFPEERLNSTSRMATLPLDGSCIDWLNRRTMLGYISLCGGLVWGSNCCSQSLQIALIEGRTAASPTFQCLLLSDQVNEPNNCRPSDIGNRQAATLTRKSSVSQPLWDRGLVNSFFIRRGPGPNKFTCKYLSIFLSSYIKLT
jgi:hypothetical protein